MYFRLSFHKSEVMKEILSKTEQCMKKPQWICLKIYGIFIVIFLLVSLDKYDDMAWDGE